tara:strand:+ start:430 stop:804 length:375 start_codon:yes stop_codon:yes gene_type:complete
MEAKMNLLEKMKAVFQKKELVVEEEKEEPVILPEELIIPGDMIAPVLNLYRLIQKTEEDIARQLMKNRQQEMAMFESLKKIEDITQEKVAEVKTHMGIPEDNNDYELILPGQTGKEGKFQKIRQ